MVLKGFTNPQSPTGKASLVEDVPHHISAEAIQVVFRVDPDVAQRYLPEDLEPSDPPLGFAYVADMLKVSASEPDQHAIEPERTQYNEGIVGLYCKHGDDAGRFSAFIWVTKDWSMAFGHFMGLPKKLAQVHKTRIHDVNPGMGPIGSGTKLRGVVDRLGTRVLDVAVTLEERLPDDGIPAYGHRVFMHRVLPSPSPHVPTTRQLFSLKLGGAKTVDCWKGSGTVQLADGVNEELEALAPGEVTGAYFFRRGWTTKAGAELVWDHSGKEHANA
ncbi:MAG: hypothetical protein GEU93_19030 [Propionibacteriales bacterium]|nr:hypothetical protein [Propionibacteriales bacterium]